MFWLSIVSGWLGCGSTDTCDAAEDTEFSIVEPSVVTVGVFTQEDDGCYVDTGKTLVFDIDEECFVWTRTAQGHDDNGGLEAVDGVHDHFNAGDEMSYVDGVFTWTEYGPEHNQEDIEATCGLGEDGFVKAVNATDYYADHGGLYLRIIDIE